MNELLNKASKDRSNYLGQQGFSLVELLIGMTLGVILIAGMLTVFVGNRRSSEMNNEMANMQENARFAINAISADARMGGFQGCADINAAAAHVLARNAPALGTIYESATTGSVVVSDTVWTPPPPRTFVMPNANPPVPGTHALVLQYGGPQVETLAAPMATPRAPVTIANNPWNVGVGDLMIIANCEHADLFRITSMSNNGVNTVLRHAIGANGNAVRELQAAYGKNPRTVPLVMQFRSEVYYVGDTGLRNDAGDSITALYRQSLPYNGQPVELVQGVENFRIRFGVRSDSGQLRYLPPDSATLDPGRVESIQIGLLMVSYDHIAAIDDKQTYVLAGQAIPPTEGTVDGSNHAQDRRYRLAFNTTVQIRNRRPRTTY